jgi:hypothetical protein
VDVSPTSLVTPATPVTPAAPAAPASPSGLAPSDLAFYAAWKERLVAALKIEGNHMLGGKDAAERAAPLGLTGLVNTGNSCFLNSMLQGLFSVPAVRGGVFRWRHDLERDGSPEQCIMLQLQRTFASMALSARPAVDTRALTLAFGWGSADGVQQHDVAELTQLLLGAIERNDPAGAVTGLFAGALEDYLEGVKVRRERGEGGGGGDERGGGAVMMWPGGARGGGGR